MPLIPTTMTPEERGDVASLIANVVLDVLVVLESAVS